MYVYVNSQGLNVSDLEDLLEDIDVYRTIEKDTNLEFWKVCFLVPIRTCTYTLYIYNVRTCTCFT